MNIIKYTQIYFFVAGYKYVGILTSPSKPGTCEK